MNIRRAEEGPSGPMRLLAIANAVVAVILTGAAFYALRRIL